jgi:hypothetical protein
MRVTHGQAYRGKRTSAYRAWDGMRDRCMNPNHPYFHRYGGRGIDICPRWHWFENFLKDMGEPAPGRSLERRNNDKGYSKNNCYWATRTEQTRNRSNTIRIKGKTIGEWSEVTGLPYRVIWQRHKDGWTIDDILTKPVRPY